MQVGDLVRNSFNRQTGIILSEAALNGGPHVVWRVLVSGKVQKWQKYQMEVISASR